MVVDMVLEYKLAQELRPRDDIAYTARACECQIGWLQNGARVPKLWPPTWEKARHSNLREGTQTAVKGIPQDELHSGTLPTRSEYMVFKLTRLEDRYGPLLTELCEGDRPTTSTLCLPPVAN